MTSLYVEKLKIPDVLHQVPPGIEHSGHVHRFIINLDTRVTEGSGKLRHTYR